LPSGTVGVAYTTVTLTASGGTAPYTWSIISGSLPQGLNFNGGAGTISGTPTASGTSNFTVQVSDGKSVTATKAFSILVVGGLTITTAPGLPGATIGSAYSVTVSAGGGTPPYTWSVTAGSLPAGLNLNASTGAIAGTPTTSGSFQFTMLVTDSASVTSTKQFTLLVAQTLTFTTPPALPNGVIGTQYNQGIEVSGGTGPYAWALLSGALPGGLSLSSLTGVISGTPVSTGTFVFTVEVRDSNSSTINQQFTLIVVSSLTIATLSPLPVGAVDSPYKQTLSAAGGKPPYTWALAQGVLPAGLTLKGTTGIISGTPTSNGTSTFSIQVTDQTGATSTRQFSLTISAGLLITSDSTLPAGTLAEAYAPLALAVIGGTQPYTWSIMSGSMAPGLSLSTTGIISGTPTVAGAFSFTARVNDASGNIVTQMFTISIIPPALPQVNISGVPQTSPAGQQISFGLALASAYPLDISGQISLSFQPNAVAPATDPAMQFSSGGTIVSFAIPANSLNAVFAGSLSQIGLQTGTVSGGITLTFTMIAGGADLPTAGLDRTITIPRSAPVIQSVKMVKNSTGFEVHVVCYSPSRDLTEADLTFAPVQGATLVTTSVTDSLTSVATSWYQGATSTRYGSQLMLVLPFTASQGSVDSVGSVSVVMKNVQGGSQSGSGTF
jgi:hypothetical protein